MTPAQRKNGLSDIDIINREYLLTQWLVIIDKQYLEFEFVVRWKACFTTIIKEITVGREAQYVRWPQRGCVRTASWV